MSTERYPTTDALRADPFRTFHSQEGLDSATRTLYEDFPPNHQHTYSPDRCMDALFAIYCIHFDDPEVAHVLGERVLFAALRWEGLSREDANTLIDMFNQLPRNY